MSENRSHARQGRGQQERPARHLGIEALPDDVVRLRLQSASRPAEEGERGAEVERVRGDVGSGGLGRVGKGIMSDR